MTFIIYSLARTGSTSLARALNLHPGISCLVEPFNPDTSHLGGRLPALASAGDLQSALKSIAREYNGIKHVASPYGFPFQGCGPALNLALLDQPGYRYIYLHRRNLLRRLVSAEVAKQCRVWHFWNDEYRSRRDSFNFQPLDIGDLRTKLARDAAFGSETLGYLRGSGHPCLELAYETLFSADPAARLAIFDEIARFLDLPPWTAPSQALSDTLSSTVTWTNSPAIYHRIPNIAAIETALGADETGHLFP
ncbi:hypothetical protein [Streptomyces syringium]|uniref:hypothetical protein n=1 Tax=Streptomyces syringium TaxID=76729 RepID=UPI00345629AE